MGNTEKKKEFVLRTKKVKAYFRGYLKKWDNEWHIICTSCAGGPTPPLLDMIDWRTKTKKEMLAKIKKLKKKHNLTSRA